MASQEVNLHPPKALQDAGTCQFPWCSVVTYWSHSRVMKSGFEKTDTLKMPPLPLSAPGPKAWSRMQTTSKIKAEFAWFQLPTCPSNWEQYLENILTGSPGCRKKPLFVSGHLQETQCISLTTWIRITCRCLLEAKSCLSTMKELRISGSEAGNMFSNGPLVILAYILIFKKIWYIGVSLVAQLLKNPPAM